MKIAGPMVIAINAINLRSGGGWTHLRELLKKANPASHGFNKIILIGGAATLDQVEPRPWLVKMHSKVLDRGLFMRTLWQITKMSKVLQDENVDLLFVPGGSVFTNFHPTITMSRNMLPFDFRALFSYGFSIRTIKFLFLRVVQRRSFRIADKVIFLSQRAFSVISKICQIEKKRCCVIPHGVDTDLAECFKRRCQQWPLEGKATLRMVYVSSIEPYKNHDHVVAAVAMARAITGIDLQLEFIGGAYQPTLKRLKRVIAKHDPKFEWVRLSGEVDHDKISQVYALADIGIFTSTCENLPNTLLEMMASGMPIICSNVDPMAEMVGNYGTLVDPSNIDEICLGILSIIKLNKKELISCATQFQKTAAEYSWDSCADATFSVIASVSECQK
jgi:glycosyltransferase involved in cell wall biosynthesis